MRSSSWVTLPAAALLLAGALASCSGKQTPKQPQATAPAPGAVPGQPAQKTLQQTSQELAAQQGVLDQAHQATLVAEQQLAQSRAREDQERAKLIQLQQRASRNLDEAQQRSQMEQAAALHAQGLNTAVGEVTEATPTRVVIHTKDGRTMSFAIAPRTRVMVGSEQRSVADIQQGADALVAFDPRADRLTAVTIRVTPAVPR